MKNTAILFLLFLWPSLVFSQFGERTDDEDPDVKELSIRERFFVGGFLGLQFGTFTAINVSTHAGYRITNRLSAGIGGTYQYANDKWWGESFTSHIYGGGVFARFRVIDQAFIHAEHEWLSVVSRAERDDPTPRQRVSEKNLLLGPGYGLKLSRKVRLNILILYNFNQNSQVYYDNPFFRVGVDIGL